MFEKENEKILKNRKIIEEKVLEKIKKLNEIEPYYISNFGKPLTSVYLDDEDYERDVSYNIRIRLHDGEIELIGDNEWGHNRRYNSDIFELSVLTNDDYEEIVDGIIEFEKQLNIKIVEESNRINDVKEKAMKM